MMESSIGMTAVLLPVNTYKYRCFVPGAKHKTSFHLLLWPQKGTFCCLQPHFTSPYTQSHLSCLSYSR